MTGLPVQQCGGAVLIQGEQGLTSLARCVLAQIRESQRNGYSIEPYARLLTSIHAARMSAPRHENTVYVVAESHSEGQGGADWYSVAEAAAVLALSRRQTQRLAQQLALLQQAKRIGTTWALQQAPVLALAEERKRKARNGER
jgi:hypothetical protein